MGSRGGALQPVEMRQNRADDSPAVVGRRSPAVANGVGRCPGRNSAFCRLLSCKTMVYFNVGRRGRGEEFPCTTSHVMPEYGVAA